MSAKFEIIIRGDQGSGKTEFIHQAIIPWLRAQGLGGRFFEEGADMVNPSMTLTGEPFVNILETNDAS
jgi:hypothetical protein